MAPCTSPVWPHPSPGLLCPSPRQWEAEEQCVLLTCPREEAADLQDRMRDPGCRPFSTRAQHYHTSRSRHNLPASDGDPQHVKLEVPDRCALTRVDLSARLATCLLITWKHD